MASAAANKAEIVKQYQRSKQDTGSSEVQIALLTARINGLTEHLKLFKKDLHSQRGLMQMVSDRRRLMKYFSRKEPHAYKKLIEKLGIRDINKK